MHTTRKAQILATDAHAAVGQKRKYTGEDYIVHPGEVAAIVAAVGGSHVQVSAAWCHDVLEDTKVTEAEMRKALGDEITDMVLWLTDVSKPTDGNRKVRKAIDREHTARCPPAAATVKLADIISNTKSIVEHDLSFAGSYLEEMDQLLDVLKHGDQTLWAQAYALVQAGKIIVDTHRVHDALGKMDARK